MNMGTLRHSPHVFMPFKVMTMQVSNSRPSVSQMTDFLAEFFQVFFQVLQLLEKREAELSP